MTRHLDESHPLALAALLGPLVALYAALGMAPLFALTAAAALALGWTTRPWRRIWRPGAAGLGALVAWAALSLAWTIEPAHGLVTVPRLLALGGGGLLLAALAGGLDLAGRRRVALALAAGITAALAMAVIEIHVGGPGDWVFHRRLPASESYIPKLGRGLTVCAVLLLPAMVAAWRLGHRAWALVILVLAVVAFGGGRTLAAKLALAIIPLAALLGWWRPRLAGFGLAFGAIAAILAFPLLALAPPPQEIARHPLSSALPNSANHRLTIWWFTAGKIVDHPLAGWGIEASRGIPGAEEVARVERYQPALGHSITLIEQYLPLHPHNAPGQIWLELGGIGALLACGLMVVLARRIASARDRLGAAMLAAATATAFLVSTVSYGIWQSWWLGSLLLAAAFCAALGADDDFAGPAV